jgi:N-acyl-phosphatidylethanolamine-hydrolysing phospholipase D
MAPVHVNPEEAVRIHQDVRSKQSVAMHWGTFRLTLEPLDEPPQKLREALAAAKIGEEQFWILRPGETRRL